MVDMKHLSLAALLACLSWQAGSPDAPSKPEEPKPLSLGAFSVSLAVEDLAASKRFYEQLGFRAQGEYEGQDWIILKSGSTVIGLFQGMFEENILTFNPGWNADAKELESFTDIREIQAKLIQLGIDPVLPIDEEVAGEEGPASFVLVDPDGNQILVDQHR